MNIHIFIYIHILYNMSSFKLPLIISVEGNIGAGKSTILEKMQNKLESEEIVFVREPVDIWEQIKDPEDGENILVKFYKDPDTYSFSFQVMAYATRVALLRNVIQNNPMAKIIICERSLDADRNIFAKMLRDEGKIKNIDFQIYDRFFKEYSQNMYGSSFWLSGIVYIDADPDICERRIMKRAREGESGIPLEYLKKCRDYHKKWLIDGEDLGNSPVLKIKTNEDATYSEGDLSDCGNKWISEIADFILNMTKVSE